METLCPLPPAGWYCTRKPGHEGPCAAHPTETAAWERQRTDVDEKIAQAPTAHQDERITTDLGHLQRIVEPERNEMGKTGDEWDDAMRETYAAGFAVEGGEGESTSMRVASTAARLLGAPNILMRASPFHAEVLKAVKEKTKQGVTAEMLDLLEALAVVIEPFMQDVRIVAGSALTQVEPVVADPDA